MVAHLDPSPTGDGDDGHADLCVSSLAELEARLRFARRTIIVRFDRWSDPHASASGR
jgi:hypothetical protein